MSRLHNRILVLLSCGPLLVGCAEAAFSVHAEDNNLRTLQTALSKMAAQKAETGPLGGGHAMAYVFAGPAEKKDAANAERTLYGYDLTESKLAFQERADVRSRFVIGRGVLAYKEGEDALVLRDPGTGRQRARVALLADHLWVGAAADAEGVYYVQQSKAKGQRRSQVTAVSLDGQVRWSVPAPGTVGAPAIHGGVLALPYRYQELVLLDAKTGLELSRIRQKDEQISFVRSTPEGLFYGVGDKGVALLDERSVKGERKDIGYLAPNLGSRVRTFLYWDAYRSEQADFSAFDRNRLLWDGHKTGEGITLRDGLAVLHSYRFLFGVAGESGAQGGAPSGKIRWAYGNPRYNLMASTETGGAVVFAAQDGEIGAVDDQSGAKVYSQKLALSPNQQVLGAIFDAAGFAPKGDGQKPDVLQVLDGIIFDKDSSFIAVKSFAVQAVNTLPGKEATAELLKVVTAEAMPSQVTQTAGEALVARQDRDVTTMLVSALSQGYDFLENRQPRGVGVLARAAAAMGAKEAIPALTMQISDPTTSPAVLKDVVGALVTLGSKDAVRPLREMLLMYRSDPLYAKDTEAIKVAGEGLLKLGGDAERRTLLYISLEPRTIAPIASYFQKLLDDTAKRPSTKPKAADESPEATPVRR